MYLDQWLANAKKLTPKTQSGRLLLNVFGKSLEWIYSKEYRGGCHDTSAAIYILLSELGLSPVLCIGEVKHGQSFFDHSWIELNNKIYDAAVCMPKVGGVPSSPVFASKDLTTNKDTELIYGVASPVGYDGEVKTILHMTIGEYSEFHADDPNKVWNLTKLLGKEAGKKVNVGKIRKKYSSIRRLERHEPAQGKAL
jgi:hypothetical protein